MPYVRILLICLALTATAEERLRLRAVEGSNAEVARNGISSQRFTVHVSTAGGEPAQNVIVTFRLPASGVTGRFLSGLASESLMTDAKGEASVRGIRFGDTPGPMELRVIAAAGPDRAEISIGINISATKTAPQPTLRTGGRGKIWWLVAAAGGAAVAGMAARGSSPAAAVVLAPAALSVTPSVGKPVITIGRP